MSVTEETEAKVRADREAAIERAERVAAGEEPWLEGSEEDNASEPVEPSGVKNEDVGESESDSPAFEEVDEIPEPTE